MSRHLSRDRSVTIADGDSLAVIREEQVSPLASRLSITRTNSGSILRKEAKNIELEKYDPETDAMFAKREAELRAEFDNELKTQLNMMKEKFDYVLQHEQMRSCYMLREAHRERKEKVQALQTQLECKNMTGLMYVLCSERRKSKMEKMRIIAEYTKYIHTLQDILTEGQLLILHLSRGYKTAARVDHEWREKMRSIIKEFQMYVYHFAGGTPETNQYVFDVPALLKTEAAIVDNPEEDPCYCEESEEGESEGIPVVEENGEEMVREKTWWELLDSPCRPFVMYGDMEEFQPPKRRMVVATAKAVAAKTAPPKWKEYIFNEMFVKSDCPTADVIKDEYPKHLPIDKWECPAGNHLADSESNISSSKQNTPMEFMPKKDFPLPESVQKRSLHQDSLQVINVHKPEADHKINYEKICPMEKCQRMQVDSFMRTLPSYMRASPYMLFEQTFDSYETCSPEQLEILKHRLEHKSRTHLLEDEESVPDFEPAVDGVGVQTSDELITGLPPCTCNVPYPSIASSTTRIFKVEDLLPMKEALDEITKECFHNQHILFDRFKVVGQDRTKQAYGDDGKDKESFKNQRVQEIKNILRKHPSMLDLFQPNPRC